MSRWTTRTSDVDAKASDTLAPLWLQAYLPQFLWNVGQGSMVAVLALAAKSVGASPAIAGVTVAMIGLGPMIFDLPSGRIVARIGEQRAGRLSAGLTAVGLLCAYLAPTPLLLAVAVFFVGSGWALWNLRLLTQLTRVAPIGIRGRTLALMGGVSRAGAVVGPFILAAIAGTQKHGARDAFLMFLIGSILGFALSVAARDRNDHGSRAENLARIRPMTVVKDNLHTFFTAGVGTYGINMLRASRQAMLPLWGVHIGLQLPQIATIFGLSSLLDLLLFYPAGSISDRFGRKMVAVPCIALLSIGHILLPFSHTFRSLFAVALVLGLGNSLGSGIARVLGADRAPDIGRASFLAVWQALGDAGLTTGPLVGAAVVALGSLTLAGPVVGIIGLVFATIVVRWLDEPEGLKSGRSTRTSHDRLLRSPAEIDVPSNEFSAKHRDTSTPG